MADLVKVKNEGKSTIKVGSVLVRPNTEAEVSASVLAEMSKKDAGKAANALAKDLKKAAGRKAKAAETEEGDAE